MNNAHLNEIASENFALAAPGDVIKLGHACEAMRLVGVPTFADLVELSIAVLGLEPVESDFQEAAAAARKVSLTAAADRRALANV